jgi:hypothetical protein
MEFIPEKKSGRKLLTLWSKLDWRLIILIDFLTHFPAGSVSASLLREQLVLNRK